MKHFTVRDAVKAVDGTFFGTQEQLDREISFVTSDSRTAAEGALFVAFAGARADGHDYMAACLGKGAACCMGEREPAPSEQPCIRVDQSLRAIGALAAWHRRRFDIPVVGITGSVGKTTTKEMTAAVLSARFTTHKTEKNFNNELGVPQTLLRLDDAHEAAVVEMGISDFGEMHRLTEMVRPTIAVMSVIGDAHLEFLGDHAGVLRAKGEIFDSMSPDDLAVLNGDDAMLRDFFPKTRRLTYGLREGSDFRAFDVRSLGGEGILCRIAHHGGSFEAHIPAFGQHMVYAALAGTAVGWALGMTDEEIARGIAGYRTVGERARVIRTGRYTVVSDCYNANPSSVAAALESLRLLEGRRVCILGDMLELGARSRELHAQAGAKAAACGVDLILACGPLAKDIEAGAAAAGGRTMWFGDKAALMEALPGLLEDGDNILVKASHSMAFEEITAALTAL